MLVWCYLETGQNVQALEAARRAAELSDRSAASLAALAQAEVACGNSHGAAVLRDEIEEAAKQRYVSGYDRAAAFLAAGQAQDALRCLEQAAADHDWWVSWLAVDPRWDRLRGRGPLQATCGKRPRPDKYPADTHLLYRVGGYCCIPGDRLRRCLVDCGSRACPVFRLEIHQVDVERYR